MRSSSSFCLVAVAVALSLCSTPTIAFAPIARTPRSRSSSLFATMEADALATDVVYQLVMEGVTEQACLDAARAYETVTVPVPVRVGNKTQSMGTSISYIHWPTSRQTKQKNIPPLILVPGFDSSALEFRRLGPKLAAMGIDTYAVDLLGWGFTQLEGGAEVFDAVAKAAALQAWLKKRIGRKFCLAGADVGAAAAIEIAYANGADDCKALVLIDAQGLMDDDKNGNGIMQKALPFVGLGNNDNRKAYFNKEDFATDESQIIQKLHTSRPGWKQAMSNFMEGGGFKTSAKVPAIKSPSLIIWGRQDAVLDGKEYANRFLNALPDAELQWIEECGHLPHLEKPDETAEAISDFVVSKFAPNEFRSRVETKMATQRKAAAPPPAPESEVTLFDAAGSFVITIIALFAAYDYFELYW